jgi:hypothetical protein
MICSAHKELVPLNRRSLFPKLSRSWKKFLQILHEIQSHSEHYNLPTRLTKMGRGGKRVRDQLDPIAFKANVHRVAVTAAEVEEVEVVVGVEGDNEIIGTTEPATIRLTRRMRSWRDFTIAFLISQKARNQTSGRL